MRSWSSSAERIIARTATLTYDAPVTTRVDTGVNEQLGRALVDAGLLDPQLLAGTLDACVRSGLPIGAVLISSGVLQRATLYQFFADQWGCPYIDLSTVELDRRLLERLAPQDALDQRWIPVRREDGRILVATSHEPTAEHRSAMAAVMGEPVSVMVTTYVDLAEAVRRGYREHLLEEASYGLWSRSAAQSARVVFERRQLTLFAVLLAAAVIGLVVATRTTLTALAVAGSVTFLACVAFKFLVCLRGARHEQDEGIPAADVAALTDGELPTYTVLVPVYREANIVADLVENLGALDYPAEKLEIILLLEEDDTETIAAARASNPPATFTLLVVPDGLPKTKPKACNVGLFFARGEYLVIYDAEDRPDCDQLKKAVLAFRRSGPERACVQAALNYWNVEENVLTRMFTLEYSFWFDYMLPGLDSYSLPIPLGGTSNHFRVDVLRQLGGWDPFNVTEDADLGIRASALGYSVGVINSTTYEEANRSTSNWIRQRSRWIKGYLQTVLVHLRHPRQLVRTTGLRRASSFALLIGGTPFTFLVAPPLWIVFLLSVVAPGVLEGILPAWAVWLSLGNLLLGNALMIYLSMMGAFKRQRYRLVVWSLLNPVYWILHSIASYKALWQLVVKPHYWEKTIHGISTVAANRPVASDATTLAG
jgi:cellulose synthase/poly-beta-1,6-N-acetylglucosamine synthase-like glycosyltransferase